MHPDAPVLAHIELDALRHRHVLRMVRYCQAPHEAQYVLAALASVLLAAQLPAAPYTVQEFEQKQWRSALHQLMQPHVSTHAHADCILEHIAHRLRCASQMPEVVSHVGTVTLVGFAGTPESPAASVRLSAPISQPRRLLDVSSLAYDPWLRGSTAWLLSRIGAQHVWLAAVLYELARMQPQGHALRAAGPVALIVQDPDCWLRIERYALTQRVALGRSPADPRGSQDALSALDMGLARLHALLARDARGVNSTLHVLYPHAPWAIAGPDLEGALS